MTTVINKKSIFYHIPKTGGSWVARAIHLSGLEYRNCICYGENRFGLDTIHAAPENVSEEDKKDRFSFCFVRHPVEWYRSIWAYRLRTKYLNKKFAPDIVWNENFEIFIADMLEKHPYGFVTELYRHYTRHVDFVGKQENLANDLVTALSLETFDEMALRSTKPLNVTLSMEDNSYRKQCIVDDRLRARIEDVEHGAISEFYQD